MDLQGFLSNINRVRIPPIFLYFMAFFVLGFAQGTIRRLIGIGSILFSFLFAANVAEPLGNYLGSNWTQFSKEYATMIGFMTVFLASSIAFARRRPGAVQDAAALPEGALRRRARRRHPRSRRGRAHLRGASSSSSISFFRIPGIGAGRAGASVPAPVSGSRSTRPRAAAMFRDTVILMLFLLTGFLVPDWIERNYPR